MDNVNDVPMLLRREIEARIAGPLIQGFIEEIGREQALKVASDVIKQLARDSGAELASQCESLSLRDLATASSKWSEGGANESKLIAMTETNFDFNIVRCKYAEMYKDLGLADLGFVLSCDRDAEMYAGFNPEIEFTRTTTIMEGGEHCDFRLKLD